MTTETIMHADTPVSFTIELPQALAEQLIAKAKAVELTPELLIRKAVTRFLRVSTRSHTLFIRTLQKNEEVRDVIRELIREELQKPAQQTGSDDAVREQQEKPGQQPAPNAAAVRELQKKLSMLKEERKLAVRRLCDTEHSVKLTAQKIEEYETERQTLEEEQKSLLDEIAKSPVDRKLIKSLDEVAEKLFTAKYNRNLMEAQHRDATLCCAERKHTVELLDREYTDLIEELRRKEEDMQ